MKLAVVTITCRPNPRLAEAGRCLATSLARTKDVDLFWIIVDERGRQPAALLGGGATVDELAEVYAPLGARFDVQSVPPISSAHRNGNERLPAHNSARNAGLLDAARWGAEYVVFLNDCNMVTADWVQVAKDCSEKGLGWSCKLREVADLDVPKNGYLRFHDHHDLLRWIPTKSAPRAAWGAPMQAFVTIGGFDMAYDGQKKGNDIEAAIRLDRIGVKWVSTERAFTVQLRRTKQQSDVTTNRQAITGANNQKRLSALLRDKTRTEPERGVDLVLPGVLAAWGKPTPPAGPVDRGTPSKPQLAVVGESPAGDARSGDDAPTITTVAGAAAVASAVVSNDGALATTPPPAAASALSKIALVKPATATDATKEDLPPVDAHILSEGEMTDLADEFDTGGVD